MLYSGKSITIERLENGIVELCFNLQGQVVNVFDAQTLTELCNAGTVLSTDKSIKGLLVTSAKSSFIVGADISEFDSNFSHIEAVIVQGIMENHRVFNAIEDLPFPTISLINGLALGGGLEMALACDYRIMSNVARVGLPEVKLGIYPGFGGTVRLSRLIGADNAIEWIASGKEYKALAALNAGVVDAMVEPEQLRASALKMLEQCIVGKLNYQAKRQEKIQPLKLAQFESILAFESAKGFIAGQSGPHYPAPVAAVKAMQKHATLGRDDAQLIEARGFAKLAKTGVAKNLVNLFLGDQKLLKDARNWIGQTARVKKSGVLGAGIMGGGIAYQSASKGINVVMKDIAQQGLDLGLNEASQLLAKKVSRKRITPQKMAQVLNRITPTLDYSAFEGVDIVVEAVVENPMIKHAVLKDVEDWIDEDVILTSNTSTISIDYLASVLKRPENFCGMHFFNPVHKMPLIEVIRGEKTSEKAIARTVSHALAMGKKPIVVRDCPGFLVNRILSPYLGAFMAMVHEGADFVVIDKVMEKFGMPMGPAYLCDVVGMDTNVHAGEVMAEGFERMSRDFTTAAQTLFSADRLGQKNGKGFYVYQADKKGRVKKQTDDSVWKILEGSIAQRKTFTEQDIIDRLMIPLCLEAVRCLEDDIVASANDVDMALIYGIGFPAFRGGALRFIESMGIKEFVELCDSYIEHGALYAVTEKLRLMAKHGESFFNPHA
ncbi:multifunctional fatty acid oxidation complex subunit alpha [Gammaproteobacteria bacterium 42_54_T18]|nr:multifunctional fatty acid oxidation complex subunit alpha [Gammaproteobacteria bacterium 42_54_T18]